MSGVNDFLDRDGSRTPIQFHISNDYMLLLRKAHLGEVSVTVWPKILKEMCAKRNIFVLE
ncbi:MAG: hypothetical protein D6814_07390 [Calditrichaeota bacterium]|nr:MAG: hypothetical protein D6814_07390 [Calditrichota bacterium]